MLWSGRDWCPATVERVIETFRTSTRPAKVMTDRGPAFLKGMGNPAGNDALACEIVAGELAHLIGLRVPEFAVVELDFTIQTADRGPLTMGPAFVSRALPGATGDGGDTFLAQLRNPKDVAKLVLFDSWIRNHDRAPPADALDAQCNLDNLFFTPVARKFDIVALDHSHCFVEGELSEEIGQPDVRSDDRICGLFPEFQPFLDEAAVRDAAQSIAEVDAASVREILGAIPAAWGVSRVTREVWLDVILDRGRLISAAGMEKLLEQRRLAL